MEGTQTPLPPTPTAENLEGNRWHSLDAEEAAQLLAVEPETGLAREEARERLERFGPNRLPEEEGEGALLRFLKQFHNVLIYVLLVAAVFTAFLGEWIDTGVILAVVLVNAIIGFVQEGKAEQALEGIRDMLSPEAQVRRDGQRETLDAEELVPGDLVLLESGDRVPADLRIISAKNARLEEAMLTGESEPVSKQPAPVDDNTALGDRKCMAYSGTLMASGQLQGIVVATGVSTEIGKIGEMVRRVETITTPLLEKIGTFGKWLSAAILAFSVAVFGFGALFRDYALSELFLIVVSLVVASIPEGLHAIMTITLALGVQRMAQRNAIIRRLPAVETLGSVTVICSDKTGTLTRNEMMVSRVVTTRGHYQVTGSGYEPEGEFRSGDEEVEPLSETILGDLIRGVFLCNDAEFTRDPESDKVRLQGDPTEGAVTAMGLKAGLDRKQEFQSHPRLDMIPFESENRFMATLNGDEDGKKWIYVKGAPERVLEMCEVQREEDGDAPLRKEDWEARVEEVASEGNRLLAVAVKEVPRETDSLSEEDITTGLTLLGLLGLIDPPRTEAAEAVKECQRAGIRVKMITGDHVLTAQSIGAQVGIGDGTSAVTGAELDEVDDDELVEIAERHDVFARTSPEHKLRLVQALQKRQHITAMTGDGVNDAPALKRADIGVAMGIKGSEASKSAAEMVLADDNFASIQKAVAEGRTVYDNLKKTILFILPTNGAEALLVVTAVLFAFEDLPITPVQILWVNMVTAVTLALALAFEPPEQGIMDRPPRPRKDPILSPYLVWRIGFVAVLVAVLSQYFFFHEYHGDVPVEQARTMTVNVLVAGQLFYLFNSRFIMGPSTGIGRIFSNRAALVAVGVLVLLQGIFTYTGPFQTWFGTAPLGLEDVGWILAAGLLVFLLVELEKAAVRWYKGLPRHGARAP